jgi:hypothetical protein
MMLLGVVVLVYLGLGSQAGILIPAREAAILLRLVSAITAPA